MFEEMYADIGMPGQGGYSDATSDAFALVVGDDEDTVLCGDAHAAYGAFGSKLHAFFKCHVFQFWWDGDDIACFA